MTVRLRMASQIRVRRKRSPPHLMAGSEGCGVPSLAEIGRNYGRWRCPAYDPGVGPGASSSGAGMHRPVVRSALPAASGAGTEING